MLFSMRLSRVVGLNLLFVAAMVAAACSDPLATVAHEGEVTAVPKPTGGEDETIAVDPDAIQGTFTKDLEVLTASYDPDEATYAVLALDAKARDTIFVTAVATANARTPMMWLVYAPSEVVAHESQRGSNYHRASLSEKLKKSGTYYIVLRELDRIQTNFEVTLRRIPAVAEEESAEPTPPPGDDVDVDAGIAEDAGVGPVSFDGGVQCADKYNGSVYVPVGTEGCACSHTGKYQYCRDSWCDASTNANGMPQ